MFRGFSFVPADTKIDFVRLRTISWVVSALLTVVPLFLVWSVGLNFGIDFQGGTLIEIKTKESTADLASIRSRINALNIGEVQIQEFGAPDNVPAGKVARTSEYASMFFRSLPSTCETMCITCENFSMIIMCGT